MFKGGIYFYVKNINQSYELLERMTNFERIDNMAREIPKKYKDYLGKYGPQLYDPGCGEIVGWGHIIIGYMGKENFEQLRHGSYGSVCCHDGVWFLITKWLTVKEAIEKYGKIKYVKTGQKGGFRSVTFGKTTFLSKKLDPRICE